MKPKYTSGHMVRRDMFVTRAKLLQKEIDERQAMLAKVNLRIADCDAAIVKEADAVRAAISAPATDNLSQLATGGKTGS